jgi:hypothetical protein
VAGRRGRGGKGGQGGVRNPKASVQAYIALPAGVVVAAHSARLVLNAIRAAIARNTANAETVRVRIGG